MKYPFCEKENSEDAQYCNGCGKSLIPKRERKILSVISKNKKKIILTLSLAVLIIIAMLWLLLPGSRNDKTVRIGEQVWMTENLNVDHYRNGDPIPEVEKRLGWGYLTTGAWCYYGNDPVNGKK